MFRLYLPIIKPLIYLVLILVSGSSGYMYIEGWNFTDSMYMTVETITTVGFGEVHALSDAGKWFTMALVINGVGFYGLVINALVTNFLEKNLKTLMEENKLKEKIKNIQNHYIICGGGRMAYAMAEELGYNKKNFVIIETNPDAPVMKRNHDWLILKGDALLEETLVEAGINRSAGLAAVLPTDADNLFVVLSARRLNPHMRIETRIAHESSRNKMLQAGANKIVSPYVIGGVQMARSFVEPEVDEFLEIMMDKSNYEFEINVEHITLESKYKDKKICDTDFPEKGYIVIGVKESHGRFIFSPDPNMRLRSGFDVLLLGKAHEKSN